MRHLLLTVSLAFATASMNCFANDKVTESIKPYADKVSRATLVKGLTLGAPAVTTTNKKLVKSENTAGVGTKAILFDSEDNEVKFRAFSFYDQRIRSGSAFVQFSTNDPTDYSLVRDYAAEGDGFKYVGAATYVGDKLYGYTMSSNPQIPGYPFPPTHICEIDPITGDLTQLAEVQEVMSDLAYDPVSGYLYALSYDFMTEPAFSNIFRIDPKNPSKYEKIATFFDELMYTFSIDNGYIYAIARTETKDDTKLVRFKISDIKSDGNAPDTEVKLEVLNPEIGIEAVAAYQDMEIDKTTHRMFWWAQVSDGGGRGHAEYVELDTKTGDLITMEKIPTDAQIVGLNAPYQVAAAAAPTMVSEFSVEPGAKGANKVQISWTNPSKTYMLENLSELQGVEVFRDGQSIGKITGMTPGGKGTYTDENAPQGKHIYRVQPYNAAGAGIYKEKQVFVGNDVPAAPQGLLLTAKGTEAKLQWTAPTVGVDGGWIDVSTLKYDVVRFPDQVKVATDLAATTLTDKVSDLKGYYYEVTAKNADGVGGKAKSNTVAFGNACEIPFINSLRTQEDFDVWTVVDNNNDGTSWKFNPYTFTQYEYCANEADDYLFTPKLKMEAGKQYQVRYAYNDAHWIEEGTLAPINERLAVYYGETNKPGNNLQVIKSHEEIHVLTTENAKDRAVFTAKGNEGYVGFQCWSEPDRGILYLSDISIREYSDKDVSVVNFNVSTTANCNTPLAASVEVGNEGKSPVTGYKVYLLNADTDEVLAQVDGEEIGVGKTKVATLTWTPSEVGDIELTTRVELDGDTYPADNKGTEPITVTVAEESADKMFTVNTYNHYGWALPFYFNFNYCQNQCIYLDRELAQKGVDLTGVQFVYNNSSTMAMVEADVRISIQSTDMNKFDHDEDWNVYLVQNDKWKVVYEGPITIDQIADDVKVYIPFKESYTYNGGNLLFKYERLYSPANQKTEGPEWQFCNNGTNEEDNRTAIYKTNKGEEVETISDKLTGRSEMTPYTAFSYTKIDGIEGTLNMGTSGFSINQVGNDVIFNVVCDKVEVFDAAGALVASKQQAKQLNVAGYATGVYVVRAVVNGKPVASKFVIS